MADTLVEGSAWSGLEQPNRESAWNAGPFWVSTTTGAVVYVNGNQDVVARKTTDGGATWGTPVVAENATHGSLATWFDRQTPGDTGTKVHCAFVDEAGQDFMYAAYDINADTWSSPVDINDTLGGTGLCAFIVKTRAGGFVAGCYVFGPDAGVAYKSADGASWSSIATPHEAGGIDQVVGACPDTGDSADAAVIYWDLSANQISVKMYDDSGDSWTETAITGTAHAEPSASIAWGATTRLTDGHTIFVALNAVDSATGDLTAYDLDLDSISTPTVTGLTDVLTDIAETGAAGVFVDPNTADIYALYARGAAWASTVNVYYKKSTDGGSTWGSETAYGEDADDDIRVVMGGACGTAGGRFQPSFFNDDLSDIFVNLTNDIEIAAAGGGDPEGSLIRGKLIRGGLLRGGVLVG